jgi:hypothetical protein
LEAAHVLLSWYRNCLVHDNLTVKISAFDSSLILESSPNEVTNGHMTMNVRWMSPQVISEGQFSTKSDGMLLRTLHQLDVSASNHSSLLNQIRVPVCSMVFWRAAV